MTARRPGGWRAAAARLVAACIGLVAAADAAAGSPRLCDRPSPLDAAAHARRLQLAAELRRTLDESGAALALVSRSGVDLSRFGLRHSHAGIALRDSPHLRWGVRQLYYACDEGRPRLYDQGLAGFVLGADDTEVAHVSLLLLPDQPSRQLQAAALHPQLPLRLLAATYSANAYAFSTRYQNCNQWLAELLAVSSGGLGPEATRAAAQQWLQTAGYQPFAFEGQVLLFAASSFVPLLHHDDHPAADIDAARLRVTMPASIEAFVLQHVPGSRRIELCQDRRHVVVRRTGPPLGADCAPAPGDEVRPFGR